MVPPPTQGSISSGVATIARRHSSDTGESHATVRLVNMDQSDRRVMNKWWADQFQRAGEQNFFMVLIGEECGTLSLSDTFDEANAPPVPAANHTIV